MWGACEWLRTPTHVGWVWGAYPTFVGSMGTFKSAPHLWKIHGATMASLVCHVPCVCGALHVQEGHVPRLLGGMQIVCECPAVREVVCCASSYLTCILCMDQVCLL